MTGSIYTEWYLFHLYSNLQSDFNKVTKLIHSISIHVIDS